jgi:hypothetical protein
MQRPPLALFGPRPRPWRLLGVGVLVGALVLGGVAGAQAKDQSQAVALGGATSARVEVDMAFGQLHVAPGSGSGGTPLPKGELLRGTFRFSSDNFGPEIGYAVKDKVGTLKIAQKGGDDFAWPWEDRDSAWDLALNPTVPANLTIVHAAGEGELAFGGLTLTGLRVVGGAGQSTLDFAGEWRQSLHAEVQQGAGKLALRLPRAVGVRVAIDPGLGDVHAAGFTATGNDVYVNAAYEAAPVKLDLAVSQGAGEVTLDLVD